MGWANGSRSLLGGERTSSPICTSSSIVSGSDSVNGTDEFSQNELNDRELWLRLDGPSVLVPELRDREW